MKFETLEAAQKAYDTLENEFSKYKSETKIQLELKDTEISEVKAVAEDAIAKFNSKTGIVDIRAKVGKSTYRVNFGVDGKTKEQVADDSNLLAKLVKAGSGALTLVEG
ncbi:hypothetical protein OHD16_21460 [Sphingobacterium sp. ML3W]|uniref:hypothetical protein n=1 Tax=Sphingobacterium sp. ML3W TaxID=1538644 RepID=UPI00249BD935|nr:hypothetical protein [Sphingobacterium sp. ML3W]WFA77300.1 hypothetical protein OGI71_14600 [Sphingobacterium sp. ML3W]